MFVPVFFGPPSTTGSVFIYAGGPIHWKSQRQSLITLSSTEAEFVSICSTVKETVWIRKLAQELDIIDEQPTTVYCDNQSAIRIASNEKSIHRTRHMSVQASYPREQIEKGEITLKHVRTNEQLADMLTKPTTTQKFESNSKRLMTTWAYCLSVLFYIATLTITLSNGYLFERVNPVIWIPTENYVEEGITTYDLDLTYGNPCDTVPTERTHRYASDSLFPEDYAMYKTIKRDCQNMFDAHWSARLIELASMTPQNNQQNPNALHRRRRNPFVLILGGIVFGVVIVTNLVATAVSYVLPFGDTHRINELETQQEKDRKRLDELERKFNMSETIQQGIINSLDVLTKQVYEISKNTTSL